MFQKWVGLNFVIGDALHKRVPVQLSGSAEAQFSLGQYHLSQQNYAEALRYFEMAEKGGSTQARYQLGVMYYDGLGVKENPVSLVSSYCMYPNCNSLRETLINIFNS